MIEMKKELTFKLLDKIKYNSLEIYFNNKNNINLLEIFIYASGKTASTSLFDSFKKLNFNCIHVHGNSYFLKHILKQELYREFHLFDYINYISEIRKNILIVDVVREPIGRKISSFFQHLDRLEYVLKGFENNHDMIKYYSNNVTELIDMFNDKFLIQKENYYAFDEYTFDGLHIKNYQFNHKKHRMYFKHHNKAFLIIRFDDIPYWDEIFKDIGYKNFELVEANKTELKDIALLYKKFKEKFYISKKNLDKVYNRHRSKLELFYTDVELQIHYDKWLKYVEK